MKEHYYANPRVRLNVFIDDIAMDATTDSKFDTAELLVKAGQDLSFSFQECLGLKFAGDKSAVLSNSLATANLVRKGLKDLGGPALKEVRPLGVDFWAARPGKPRMRVRKSRGLKLSRRRHRINKLAGAHRPTGAKIFVSGVVPAILFDAPVYGLFGQSLKALRREAGAICGITGRNEKGPRYGVVLSK